MSVPIPGSHYGGEPDGECEPDDELATLRHEVIRLRRERLALTRRLHALQQYDSDGQPRERGVWVRHDDMADTIKEDA